MRLLPISLIIVVMLALWMAWGFYSIYNTERPPYKVIQSLSSNLDIRQYEEQTWISVSNAGDDASFRVLASYIFGDNKESKSVAMTAPVISDDKMAFILPKEFSKENAPRPNGQPIDFTTVPPRKIAALKFSWWTSKDRVEKKKAELLAALAENSIETSGEAFLMRYNDPWTPPFLRRNEVAIEVRT